ncbi:MAG: hypothetical protein PUE02_01480 [Eggerthellaceae bacterium]|nr:hypothetical protein [Eggerthellaceae bacterium]
MPALPYFGTYSRFTAENKSEGGFLLGADCIVGDRFDIEFTTDDEGRTLPWVSNRFGRRVGTIDDPSTVEQLLLCRARKFHISALLVAVYYSDQPKPGNYWGEVAIMAYDDAHASDFDAFRTHVGKKIANGARISVDLGAQGIDQVIESHGLWIPNTRQPKPQLEPGTVMLKDSITLSEKLVEGSRNKNVGCFIGGWAFLIVMAVLVVAVVRSCTGA